MNTAIQGLIGVVVLMAVAWVLSENRRAIPWRTVGAGLALQVVLALILLKIPASQIIFQKFNDVLLALEHATRAGTSFVFGYLGGGPRPFDLSNPGNSFVLAFQALPLLLLSSVLSGLLYYWRILPLVVKGVSWVLQRLMAVGGATGVNAAANVFFGMIEAPLYIRPYVAKLSRGEMFMVMTSGMATVAGTMLALYAATLGATIPNVMGHILVASVLSAPASLMIAALMIPPEGTPTPARLDPDALGINSTMHAITKGASDGVTMLINIVALLIVIIALVALVNIILGNIAGESVTLQMLLGVILRPLAWLLGVPWGETQIAGELLATKVVINELVAYVNLAKLPEGTLDPHSRLVLIYAMCGFANFGSVGIMVGGLGAMAPERHDEIIGLGLRSIVSGLLATCLTGALVGVLI